MNLLPLGVKRITLEDLFFLFLELLKLETACPISVAEFRPAPKKDGASIWVTGMNYDLERNAGEMTVRQTTINRQTDIKKAAEHCKNPEKERAYTERTLEILANDGLVPPVALNVPIIPGNSGSLVHDTEGRVLGMANMTACSGKGFFVPAENILKFAATNRIAPGENDGK